jgi:hypothetical protein
MPLNRRNLLGERQDIKVGVASSTRATIPSLAAARMMVSACSPKNAWLGCNFPFL